MFGVVVGAAVVAAPAFACSPHSTIDSGSTTGVAGTTDTVKGAFINASKDDTIEIHWDSLGGPQMAVTANNPFSVAVTIPVGATPGVYYIVAARMSGSNVAAKLAVPFEVTGPPASAPGGSGSSPPASANPPPLSPPSNPAPANPGVGNSAVAPPAAVPARPTAVAPLAPAPARSGRAPSTAPVAAPGPVPAAQLAGGQNRNVNVGGVTPSDASGPAAAPAPATAPKSEASGIDEQAPVPAPADLWSGLRPGTSPSLLDPVTSAGHGHGGIPTGAALLGLSLVALAGTAAAAGRRRFALARRTGTR